MLVNIMNIAWNFNDVKLLYLLFFGYLYSMKTLSGTIGSIVELFFDKNFTIELFCSVF